MYQATFNNRANLLATYAFRRIFDRVDKEGVKKSVDEIGLKQFIKRCARRAAATGAVAGSGGIATLVVGLPADVVNTFTQQFRVTLAVIYARTGEYELSFEELMAVVAVSIGVEAGVMITKTALVRIAERLLTRIGERTAGRLVPILGAAIGGTANYLFIKGIGTSVNRVIRGATSGSRRVFVFASRVKG